MSPDDIAQWFPHGYCLAWDWRLIGLNLVANLLTFVSYTLLALLIIHAWLVGNLPSLITEESAPMWAAFIWSCGFTHLMHILVTWEAAYWIETIALTITGLISAVTAFMAIYRAHVLTAKP